MTRREAEQAMSPIVERGGVAYSAAPDPMAETGPISWIIITMDRDEWGPGSLDWLVTGIGYRPLNQAARDLLALVTP